MLDLMFMADFIGLESNTYATVGLGAKSLEHCELLALLSLRRQFDVELLNT
jgi:hypothetical protein